MTKRETFELLKKIAVYYDSFIVDQEKVNMWHEVLKDYAFEEIQKILSAFVKGSAFPPKLSDLLSKSTNQQTIPNVEKTMKLTTRPKPASEIVVQRELARMRVILGIDRRGTDGRA